MKESIRQYLWKIITEKQKGVVASFLRGILTLFSFFYGILVRGVTFLYQKGWLKSVRVDVLVISVGNITLGGAGKTPLVIFLAQHIKNKHFAPAVLLRGYMGSHQESIKSDEEILLQEKLVNVPVLVGKNRIMLAKSAIKQGTNILLMDDGFQHWRLGRDCDIVLVDLVEGFGNGKLLPRGPLREPLEAFKRANICVLTKADLGMSNEKAIRQVISRYNPAIPIFHAIHRPHQLVSVLHPQRTFPIEQFQRQRVCAFSGIGSPTTFQKTLEKLNIEVERHFIFMDHHIYRKKDIQDIFHYCEEKGIGKVITTVKDSVKIRPLTNSIPLSPEVLALDIDMQILEEEEFLQAIDRFLVRDKKG